MQLIKLQWGFVFLWLTLFIWETIFAYSLFKTIYNDNLETAAGVLLIAKESYSL